MLLRERCVCAKLYFIEHYWAIFGSFYTSVTFLDSFVWTCACKVVALLHFASLFLPKRNFLNSRPPQGHLRRSLHVCSPAGQWRPSWKATALAHWPLTFCSLHTPPLWTSKYWTSQSGILRCQRAALPSLYVQARAHPWRRGCQEVKAQTASIWIPF